GPNRIGRPRRRRWWLLGRPRLRLGWLGRSQQWRPRSADCFVNTETVSRFDVLTRAVHWSTAGVGAIVLATATVLYVPELSAKIGRRATLMEIHVIAGLFLPVPLLFALAVGPTGVRVRRDLAELWHWNE